MAWDEWEQLKQAAGRQSSTPTQLDQHQAGEGPGPTPAGGGTGGLKSSRQAWNRAGEGVGSLREGIGKALNRLEDGQHGLAGETGCLAAGAQKDVYESWARYVKAVNGRCGRVKKVLEKAGRDLLTTEDAITSSFDAIDIAYADTPAIGGRNPGR
ncbi:hypothetical protein [Streptomyces sp. NBC_01012]|uniref:hypothetical protein n=1 Tax=Streptomyces sp. NBC_01012 TaxID=2903717 RepID=UPI0038633AD3|nr:hypothetical protein OG623_13095 [Streptomyces sp. NBC_01012]